MTTTTTTTTATHSSPCNSNTTNTTATSTTPAAVNNNNNNNNNNRRTDLLTATHNVPRRRQFSVLAESSIPKVTSKRGSLLEMIEAAQENELKRLQEKLIEKRNEARKSRALRLSEALRLSGISSSSLFFHLDRDSSIIERPSLVSTSSSIEEQEQGEGEQQQQQQQRQQQRQLQHQGSSLQDYNYSEGSESSDFRLSEIDMEEQKRLLAENGLANSIYVYSRNSNNNNNNNNTNDNMNNNNTTNSNTNNGSGGNTICGSGLPRLSTADVRISTIDVEEQRRILLNFQATKMDSISEYDDMVEEAHIVEASTNDNEQQQNRQGESSIYSSSFSSSSFMGGNGESGEDLVEVIPGLRLPIVGESVTQRAMMNGRIMVLNCVQCDEELFCSEDAALMVCSTCWTFNAVQQDVKDLRALPKSKQFIDVGVKPEFVLCFLEEKNQQQQQNNRN